ncbi:MAG TPA: tetracycline resistance MFS efflux pump [Bacteroidetes bacterium]|nr:tetracycline resistance MFS efflux pump [Bacteroidota bacterium]
MKQGGASILVIWLTVFIDLLGFSIIIPILPDLAVTLGGGKVALAVAALYALMNFLFAPLWGSMSDRIGRRPVILISIFITALAQFFFGFITTFWMLMLQRSLAGIGSANISAANAYMADVSTKETRTRNMGLIGAAFGMGFIIGPVVGGYLYEAEGMMGVGIASGMLSVVNLIMAYLLLPESIREKNPEAVRVVNPVIPLVKAMVHRGIRGIFLLNFLNIAAFSLMQVTAALLWEEHFLLSKKEIGLMFSFIGLCAVLVQFLLVGALNRWLGEKRLLVVGLVIMLIALGSMPLVPTIYWELVTLAGLALATGCVNPSLLSLLSAQAGPKEQGNILGLNQSLGSLGRVAGPVMGGVLYAIDFRIPYLGASFILLFALIFTFDLFRKRVIQV